MDQQQPQHHSQPELKSTPKHPWLWFVGLWLAGFLTVGTVAYAIKFLMRLAG